MARRTLLAVLAHPDDESFGFGGTLARYAAEGVDVHLVTATRGEGGRYGNLRPGEAGHPGREALGRIRDAELRAAASELGLRSVAVLGYEDGRLDRAEPRHVIGSIVAHLHRIRPDVVITFGPDGAYGHPDHVAISQFTTSAVMAAASPAFNGAGAAEAASHATAKLYYLAWPEANWSAYQAAFKTLTSTVDGVERRAVPWPEWAISSRIDTSDLTEVVWRAVSCHVSQASIYSRLDDLSVEHRRAIWGCQYFYRVFSTVNGGREPERDLFEGIQR